MYEMDEMDGINHSEGSGPVRVLIVDDQAPFRSAARAVLARLDNFELVGEAENGEDALDAADRCSPNLVLMDINMPIMDGIEAARRFAKARPTTVVFLMSTYAQADLPPSARDSGAAAYVNKEALAPKLLRRLWEAGGDPAWRAG